MDAFFAPSLVGGQAYLAPSDPETLDPSPSGSITMQLAPSGQSQNFALATLNAVSGAYTLIGQNGAANIGPTAFAIADDSASFTIEGIAPATYLPRFTLTSTTGKMVNIDGNLLTIIGVSGGGGSETPPLVNAIPTAPGTIADIAGTVGIAITPVSASAVFNDTDALSYSISPISAAWPSGLSVNASTGAISGTVSAAGTITGLRVRATDTAAQTVDSNAFSVAITVAAPPATVNGMSITPASLRIPGGASFQFGWNVLGGAGVSQAVTWASVLGTVTNGAYVAPASGDTDKIDTVTVTSVQDSNYSASATVTIPVSSPPVIGGIFVQRRRGSRRVLKRAQ